MASNDPFAQFKAVQREGWGFFAPLAAFTVAAAAPLVEFAAVGPGMQVLDVGCGTGVVAVTAARLGARVAALDLSPVLLAEARRSASLAGVDIQLTEGDVEHLPYPDASFDIVLSQFGHMFAPRPEVAVAEMLRVLKPGGRIAFSTWPPEVFVASSFALVARYLPPPEGVASPVQWGEPEVVRQRLGAAVRDVQFDRAEMLIPTLSPQHFRFHTERSAAPVKKVVEQLQDDPERLAAFRAEFDALAARYIRANQMHQAFLMSRATKR